MDFPDTKDLKKLASVCRKSGISKFKFNADGSYEFELDSSFQEVTRKSAKKQSQFNQESKIENPDAISEEELLFWSSGEPAETPSELA